MSPRLREELESLSLFELMSLEAEIKARRKAREAEWTPPSAGRCANCGEEWFYNGAWKQHRFEQQAEAFKEKHKNCLPIADGGCI